MTRRETTIACHCGRDECPDAAGPKAGTFDKPGSDVVPTTAQVVVHVDAATLAGMSGAMVPYIEGQGPIDPDYARLLAADATWQGLFDDATGFRRGKTRTAGIIRDGFDTNTGHHPPPGPPANALRYTPSQSLRDNVASAESPFAVRGVRSPPDGVVVDQHG